MRTRLQRRCLAVLGTTALVGTIATPAYASPGPLQHHQHPPAHRHGTQGHIPFTSATVDSAQAGTLTVKWSARGVHRVAVFAGADPDGRMNYVGSGHGTDELTVQAMPGITREYFKLVPDHGGSLVVAKRELGIASMPNFRDAGGYRTTNGQWVRMGLVYRSSAFAPSSVDVPAVAQLGIRSVYDLRMNSEIAEQPDVVPAGAEYIHLDILGSLSSGGTTLPPLDSPEAAQELMRQSEVLMVTTPDAQQGYHDLITDIANRPGAGDYHCTAGKDRTGWASAILLSLLGVPRQTIINDYLLSNTYYLNSPQVQAQLAALPPAQAAIYEHLMDVELSYLQAGFDAVQQHYGSMTSYAIHGLGLSHATLKKLRNKLLVGAPAHSHRHHHSPHQNTHHRR